MTIPRRMFWRLLLPFLLSLLVCGTAWAQQNGQLWNYVAGGRLDAVAVTADGQHIALGSRDNTLRLFDRAGGQVWVFHAQNSVLGADISADGQWTAVASEDRSVYLLDQAGQALWQFRVGRPMNNAAVADDGSLVAATANDRNFYVLDSQGNLLWQEDVGIDVEGVAIYGTAQNARVVVGADDGTVSIYSRDGNPLLQSQLDYDVQSVAVMPNGARIAAGTSDGLITLLDGSNGNVLWQYRCDDVVHSVAIAADGNTVLGGSEDGHAYLLDGNGQLIQTLVQGEPVLAVGLSADGSLLSLGTVGGQGRTYDRHLAQASYAQVQSRRRWLMGGSFGGLLLLVVLGVWAIRYTESGRQVWVTRTARPQSVLRQMWKARLSYLLLLPTLALLLTFNYYPAFSGLYHAFTKWSPGVSTEWVGLENFRFLLNDRFFLVSFRNAAILVVVTIVKTLTVPLLVAEFIFNLRNAVTRYWLRTLFVVPLVLPMVVEILVWNNIYDPTIGLLNQTLQALGLENWSRVWYGDSNVALASIIFIGFPWINPFALLIFYGGLISISDDIFDSTKVDGATALRRFWHVDLPLLMGQVRLLLILNFINAIQTFELVYLTTGGGPGAATYTPALELYYMAMRMDKMGVASAIGMILFMIILAGTILNMRYVKSSVEYDA